MTSQAKNKKGKGPTPETVKVEMDWQDAVGVALKKKRPEAGWPDGKPKKKPKKGK